MRMKKAQIAKKMARRSGVSESEAADRLDRVVNQILARLRRGEDATLPGLGRFTPGPGGELRFERERSGKHE
jgi:nucleoid DNA-binding protein